MTRYAKCDPVNKQKHSKRCKWCPIWDYCADETMRHDEKISCREMWQKWKQEASNETDTE